MGHENRSQITSYGYYQVPDATYFDFYRCARERLKFLSFVVIKRDSSCSMLKISRKFYSALDAGKFFSTNEWDFKMSTMGALVSAVRDAEDGVDFEVDMTPDNGFNWNFYVKDFILGVRQYVLKDDLSSLPSAKVKLNR